MLWLCSLVGAAGAGELELILVRHAEKAGGTQAGDPRDPPLSAQGRARAAALVEALREVPIAAVYASQFRRTRDTGQPIADALGLPVQVRPITGDPAAHSAAFARELRQRHAGGGSVLVVGHSNTLPALAQALGAQAPPAIAEDEYDRIIRVRIAADAVSSATSRYGSR